MTTTHPDLTPVTDVINRGPGRHTAVITCPHCHHRHGYPIHTWQTGALGPRPCPINGAVILIGPAPRTQETAE